MKIRTDFVTNSSSSSFIVCFARISDEEKAQKIIDKHFLTTYSASEVRENYGFWGDYIGNDFAAVYPEDILREYPNDNFIILWDSNDAWYDNETDDYIYNYSFDCDEIINDILENDGFSNIMTDEGEGFDG